jgi:hypothetical protein
MDNREMIALGGFGIVIAILLFFLLRELMCWYYKINTRAELQKETNKLLRELIDTVKKEKENPEPKDKNLNS